MTDETWARGIERELGEKTAEQRAQRSEIARIATEMKEGFGRLEDSQMRQIGSLRAELKTQRDEDMNAIGDRFDAINKHFEARAIAEAANRRLLLRVAWGIATFAFALAVATTGAQVALTEPRIAAAAQAVSSALDP